MKRDGYVEDSEGTELEFTKKGLEKAANVYSRHRLLTDFFVKVTGVSKEQAEENACRVEHDIDADIVAGIEKWMKKNKKSQASLEY